MKSKFNELTILLDVAKELVAKHDLNQPMKLQVVIGTTAFNKLSISERAAHESNWSKDWSEWRNDMDALQYGVRVAMNNLLQYRLECIHARQATLVS